MKYILIGAGSRGMTYGTWAAANGIQIAAIAELRPDRLKSAGDAMNVPEAMRFSTPEPLFAMGKIADAAIIATMDRDHYGHVMQALHCGYDILLEKPISPDPQECLAIEETANRLGRKITVCHVLRYTAFFSRLKEIIDSGDLGKVISIRHEENIGNFHMAHSFVRGNWRNDTLSSPIILQKSCHDLDILLWLTGKHCTKVSAFGSLSYFREENAPQGATDRCLTCPAANSCRYDAWQAYQPVLGRWPADVVCLEQTEDALREALRTGPYGRCVYRCDNNVCDHMSMIMEFEDGITATFSLSAHSSQVHRTIHIMCEHGEIEADGLDGRITVTPFVRNQAEDMLSRTIYVRSSDSGHGGGDSGIMEDFTASLSTPNSDCRSSISRSVESHLMAFAMEQSRLTGKTVDMAQYRNSLT
ncbi:MAG: Gfo/Idh/MocA family oxidoreductase [Oscillospiraceae bacterium]|nr:Gfo/Idh/MocA family oxidoreductase [Oscillospiraceae bacterium]